MPGPYLDVKNVWTFGIGHTAEAGPPDPAQMPRGMPVDLEAGIRESFRLFRSDLAAYEAEVRRAVKVPLAPHEFDALVSFHYNTGGIAKAALNRHLNAGDRFTAADASSTGGVPPRSFSDASLNAIFSGMAAIPADRSPSGRLTATAASTSPAPSDG